MFETGFWIAINQGVKRSDIKTVQLAIPNSDYARSLRNLLLRDGAHNVHLVDQPNLGLDGVVVIDESRYRNLVQSNSEQERFLVVTGKGTDSLSRMWEAGIRHVVFQEDPPNTTRLAIIAAEMRLPRETGSEAEKRRAANRPPLDVWEFSQRCAKCGPKNAPIGI